MTTSIKNSISHVPNLHRWIPRATRWGRCPHPRKELHYPEQGLEKLPTSLHRSRPNNERKSPPRPPEPHDFRNLLLILRWFSKTISWLDWALVMTCWTRLRCRQCRTTCSFWRSWGLQERNCKNNWTWATSWRETWFTDCTQWLTLTTRTRGTHCDSGGSVWLLEKWPDGSTTTQESPVPFHWRWCWSWERKWWERLSLWTGTSRRSSGWSDWTFRNLSPATRCWRNSQGNPPERFRPNCELKLINKLLEYFSWFFQLYNINLLKNLKQHLNPKTTLQCLPS